MRTLSFIARPLTALALLALAGTTQAQAPVTFAPMRTYYTGAGSDFNTNVLVARLNSDYRPDLLVNDPAHNSISVLLNTGLATFGQLQQYSTGAPGRTLYTLAVADVNNDGRPDVVLAGPTVVQVLLGSFAGDFRVSTSFSHGLPSAGKYYDLNLVLKDVNNDSWPDVVVSYTGTAAVMLNARTGGFGVAPQFGAPTAFSAGVADGGVHLSAVADLNGDQKPDLLTANYSTPTVQVQLGTGTGTFGPAANYPTTANAPANLTVADVNNDGKPDVLISANYTPSPNMSAVGVMLGTGTGALGAMSLFSTGGSSGLGAIAVADVNGDGQPDAITTDGMGGSVDVLLGNGAGSFGAVTKVPAPIAPNMPFTGPGNLAVADVNSDGKPDLLVTTNSPLVGVLLNLTGIAPTRSLGLMTSVGTGAGTNPRSVAVADVNNDQLPDILTANNGNSTASVLLGSDRGGFKPVATFSTGPNSSPQAITAADVNSDGSADILTANHDANSLSLLMSFRNGKFGIPFVSSTGPGSAPTSIAVADVNGDHRPDLLLSLEGTNAVGVLLGPVPDSFGPISSYSAGPGSQPAKVVVADVNNDGRPDLLTANYGSSTAGVLLGNGDSTFRAPVTYPAGPGSSHQPTDIAVADVNNDGRPDLLTANFGSSTVGVLLGNGDGTFQDAVTFSTGPNSSPSAVAATDVNGDGQLDLLLPTGNGTVVLLLGTGTGTFGAFTSFGAPGNPTTLAVADLNNDGRPDLVMPDFTLSPNPTVNRVGVLLGTTTQASR